MVVNTAIPLFFRRSRGFTLLELTAVIAIVGILSIYAAASLNRTTFDTSRYARELEATLAYAQKSAVAQRRQVSVTVAASSVTFAICSAFDPCGGTVAFTLPTQSGGATLTAPSGVTIGSTNASFTFMPSGSLNSAITAPVSITVSGSGTRTVVIEPGTGFVHLS